MEPIAQHEAREALEAIEHARRGVAAEVGLPRWYWWLLAAGWVVLGVVGDLSAAWFATVATVAYGAVHATVASRVLSGRRRTGGVQVSAETASRRLPVVVIGMLVALVALTIGTALVLDADGTEHASIFAGIFVAAVVGFGGPEILGVLRRWARA
ncbi:hypothetical protein ASC77_12775 [Nocardioides sp. Root1257]|uniref:hypothetical protein n=1 Tax=unclassified Nocardioides TaxID=2615069 RepID=UPI0006F58438|nr:MULTISPECIES: hypothetical protein [unclassified Nocardioides]KQW47341.1 hypothetical protein ASC77_12775 [Nocardioides sp. Root1257]KRC45497.1 hypothetical protein ASE24_12780 [Nocardioides sp. Root224]